MFPFQLPQNFLPVQQMNSPNPTGQGYQFAPPPMPAPQQSQDPLGGGMGLLPMMAMMSGRPMGGGDGGLLGLMGMNKAPSATASIPGVRGPMQTTISGALPDLGAQGGGVHGLWHMLSGLFGGGA